MNTSPLKLISFLASFKKSLATAPPLVDLKPKFA